MRSLSESTIRGIGKSGRSTSSQVSSRPLPLKQRTSSIDTRRDYSWQTVISLIGLIKLREYFITVDNFSIWRRHLAWAMPDGDQLRSYMTQRFASSMVFMSLLLGAELNVLFNSAAVTTSMRRELFAESFWTIEFWAGIAILISVILTLLSLISTFTAWGMVSSVSDANAHCILRSSIGQYAAELPGRFIVTAVYAFLVWIVLFFFLLLPVGFWSMFLMITTVALFIHVVVVFSAFGRIIMHTGAMGEHRIFDEATENRLLPHSLHSNLLHKAKTELACNTSIMRQYRRKRPTNVEAGPSFGDVPAAEPRQRADSSVRFADTLWTSAPRKDAVTSQLSDIASRDGAETPSSQVSLASSSADKMERPKRPPRPSAVRPSYSDSVLDALGGSNHSLEEWLKASGSAQPESSKSKSDKSTPSDGRRSPSPVGFSCVGNGGEKANRSTKPRNERQSISPVEFNASSNVQSRDGRRSVSPIDSDTSAAAGNAEDRSEQQSWRPLTSVAANRSLSAHSSIDGSESNNFHRQLTEEEKFDEEYGELFAAQDAAEMQRNMTNESQGYEVQFGHEGSDLELSDQATEQQWLLSDGRTDGNGYAAVGKR